MAGRKSKYTPERVEMILEGIRSGLTQKDAATVAGINEDTLIIWRGKYSDFADRLTQAYADRARGWLEGIAAAAPKDWRAYEALLDRCAPEYRKVQKVEQTITVDTRKAAEKAAADLGVPVDVVLAEAYRMAEGE
jgi:hypothetical protein